MKLRHTHTHTHAFLRTFTECKGNPAILHLHSKHPLPFGADPVTTLHLTHSPVTYCDTQMHLFFKDTHPLLRCWWRRNCHSPFCIDAATVRAEPRRSRRGRSHTGGRPETHWEDQNESEGQSNAPLPRGHRGIFLWWGGEGGGWH